MEKEFKDFKITLPSLLTYGENFLKYFADKYNEKYKQSCLSVKNSVDEHKVVVVDRYDLILNGCAEEEDMEKQIEWLKNSVINDLDRIYCRF